MLTPCRKLSQFLRKIGCLFQLFCDIRNIIKHLGYQMGSFLDIGLLPVKLLIDLFRRGKKRFKALTCFFNILQLFAGRSRDDAVV